MMVPFEIRSCAAHTLMSLVDASTVLATGKNPQLDSVVVVLVNDVRDAECYEFVCSRQMPPFVKETVVATPPTKEKKRLALRAFYFFALLCGYVYMCIDSFWHLLRCVYNTPAHKRLAALGRKPTGSGTTAPRLEGGTFRICARRKVAERHKHHQQ